MLLDQLQFLEQNKQKITYSKFLNRSVYVCMYTSLHNPVRFLV